jgi:hypothetical protein
LQVRVLGVQNTQWIGVQAPFGVGIQ